MGGSTKLEGKVAREAEMMLADVTRLLGKIGVRYGLDGGPLLGIVQEDRLLPWDDDMDLFVPDDQLPRLQAHLYRFRMAGYKVSVRRAHSSRGAIRSGSVRLIKIRSRKYLFWRGDLLIDLFIKYASGDRYEWIVGDERGSQVGGWPLLSVTAHAGLPGCRIHCARRDRCVSGCALWGVADAGDGLGLPSRRSGDQPGCAAAGVRRLGLR